MNRILVAIFLMALVTYVPRCLPIVLFRRPIQSVFVRSFLYYVPFAVLGAMTFPAILYSTGTLYSAVFGLGVAVVISFGDRGLLKVALGAILAVYLVEMFMNLG